MAIDDIVAEIISDFEIAMRPTKVHRKAEVLDVFTHWLITGELLIFSEKVWRGKLRTILHGMDKPDKKSWRLFILEEYRLRYCNGCSEVLYIEEFYKTKHSSTGTVDICKLCKSRVNYDLHKEKYAGYAAKRRAAKLLRTPRWSQEDEIKKFYDNRPEGMQVDHIVPLQGALVSGLHVIENLQYLTESENKSKGNKWQIADQKDKERSMQ